MITKTFKYALYVILCAVTTFARAEATDVQGRWIKDAQGQVMVDPQPSGLTHWRGKLLTISDRSATPSQQGRLHQLILPGGTLLDLNFPLVLTTSIQQSCFGQYLANQPDLEALTADPDNDRIFYTLTEDARSAPLSPECAKQWANSGSTDYPTLLLRLELTDDNQAMVTHVRPLQFKAEAKVGNFPNDGFEGMTFGPDRMLYLALEKDMVSQARIFQVRMNSSFWLSNDFIPVEDAQLRLPEFKDGNHPLNGMDYYPSEQEGHPGFLLAIARNVDQLWVIDLSKHNPGKLIQLAFWAEVLEPPADCNDWELMDNASIEGVAVIDDIVWMINDPWKVNYLKNIQCEVNRPHYEKMAPLLFALPTDKSWFR
ncbi:hypothetical protein [Neptunicella sp. SCSIO 80796]|uniref:hypothetical protein n=1 Tax=Neptunicella plasticusilytica TaxID=3117012 RepID=UPI003A4D973E